MAKLTDRTVSLFECDGCGMMRHTDPASGELPYGFHGNVSLVDSHGADGGDWYACGRGCVQRAVLAAADQPTRAET